MIPEFLLEENESQTYEEVVVDSEEEITKDQEQFMIDYYISLTQKREIACNALNGDLSVTVKRNNIVKDVLNLYKTHIDVTKKNIFINFEGENAVGTGVGREMFVLFWEKLLSEFAEGDSECAIPVALTLSEEDYLILGKIITHQFLQFEIFPVRLNQASIQYALFGGVSEECKLSSLLRFHPMRERECLSNALSSGHASAFPVDEVIDLLEDYGDRQMPSAQNIKEILSQVATSEFITKPHFCLTTIRKGMGSFWNDITKEELESLYAISKLTPESVIESLNCYPSNAKEEQVFRWLKRYLKGEDDQLLSQFLRFCTASDIIVPGAKISVRTAVFPPAAVRPTSQTCFRTLTLPRNYESFSQMKANLNVYLKDTATWMQED